MNRLTLFFLLASLALPAARAETATQKRLDEITVRARKTEEARADVPLPISVITPQSLEIAGASGDDITYLSARSPSLIAESSFGRTFPRFYIRGLGNPDFDLNTSQPISLVYDEIPYESPILKGFPLFDVEQVEVLRGPQGTLFGRNTTAGTIRVDSARPDPAQSAAGLRASYGLYDTANLSGWVNLPLGTQAALRVSGLSQSRSDWIDNRASAEKDAFGGYRETAWRAQLAVAPTAALDLLLNAHGRRLDGEQTLFRANIFDAGSNALNANFIRDGVWQDAVSDQTLDQTGLTFRATYDLGGPVLTYVLGWENAQLGTRGDGDGGAGADFLGNSEPGSIRFPSESGGVVDDLTQLTHEIRLASDTAGRLDWQVGAFAFSEDVSIVSLSYATFAGGAQNGRADRLQKTDAWAVFAATDYALSDRVSLSGGLRYTDDGRDFTAGRSQSPIGAGPLAPRTVSVSDAQWSGDMAIRIRLQPDTSAYARIARGFRAPTVQGRLVFGNDIFVADSETLVSVEGGLRHAGPRLTADLAIFRYVVDGLQLSAIGGQSNTVRLINADEGLGYGAEGEFDWRPSDRLRLSAALSWTHTEIRDAGLSVPVCGAPCTVLDPPGVAARTALIDGNPFPYAPEWVGNLTAEYTFPVSHGEWFALTDWTYTGERNFLLYESAEFRGRAFWEGGLRLGYRSGNGGWDAALFARNILDEEAALGGVDFNNLAGYSNSPRIVGVEFGWRTPQR